MDVARRAQFALGNPVGRSPGLLGAAVGALVVFVLMVASRGHHSSGCCLPASNAARGVIDGLLVGDASVCGDAMTQAARRDAAHLLDAAGAQVAAGHHSDGCGTMLLSASPIQRRSAFADFTGDSLPALRGGSAKAKKGTFVIWTQLRSGTFVFVELTQTDDDGWLVSALRRERTCSVCR